MLNETVKGMDKISLTGFIVPPTWFKTIRTVTPKGNTKPHQLAINILSVVAYWYKPTYVMDEATGSLKCKKNKFSGKLLQKNYSQLSDFFGVTHRTVGEACRFLSKDIGVLKLITKDVTMSNGGTLQNVMFMDIDLEVFDAITFIPDNYEFEQKKSEQSIKNEEEIQEEKDVIVPVKKPKKVVKKASTEYEKTNPPNTKKSTDQVRKNVVGLYEKTYLATTEKSTYTKTTYKDYLQRLQSIKTLFDSVSKETEIEFSERKYFNDFLKKKFRQMYIDFYNDFHIDLTDGSVAWSGVEGSIQGKAINSLILFFEKNAKENLEIPEEMVKYKALEGFCFLLLNWEKMGNNGKPILADFIRNNIKPNQMYSNISAILKSFKDERDGNKNNSTHNGFAGEKESFSSRAVRMAQKATGNGN